MTACQNRQIRCQALGTRHIVQLSWLILLHELRLVHSNYCQTPLPPISSRHVNQLLSQALSGSGAGHRAAGDTAGADRQAPYHYNRQHKCTTTTWALPT